MGCDIHICIEAWSERETFRTLFKGDRRLLLPRGWSCVNEWKDEEDESRYPLTWCHRNYNLFAILADVRNGIGFAGIDTGEGFIPISAPKGLPDDVTAEVKQWSDGWGVDGHSHSFLTLAEIFEFDWTRTTKCRGMVSGPQYEQWSWWGKQNGNAPSQWCGSVSGPNITIVEEDEMINRLAALPSKRTDREAHDQALGQLVDTYAKVSWETTYHRAAAGFWSELVPELLRYGAPEHVRIVFLFDN